MARLKLVARHLADEEWVYIVALADAGMSWKFIAKEVYGTQKNGEPSESSVLRVKYILQNEGTKVTDYRNGKNRLSRSMVSAIRKEADVLSAIRSATAETTAALKRQSA
jgi:hypothetical protein